MLETNVQLVDTTCYTSILPKFPDKKISPNKTATLYNATMITIASNFPERLEYVATDLTENGYKLKADSLINKAIVNKLKLNVCSTQTRYP